MRKFLIVFFVLALWFPSLFAASIQVTWDANTETDLAGYKVYFGTAPGVYGPPVTVTSPTFILPDVVDKTTYYFAVSAFDTSGNESVLSDEASKYVPDVTPPAKPTGLLQRLIAWLKGLFGVA